MKDMNFSGPESSIAWGCFSILVRGTKGTRAGAVVRADRAFQLQNLLEKFLSRVATISLVWLVVFSYM